MTNITSIYKHETSTCSNIYKYQAWSFCSLYTYNAKKRTLNIHKYAPSKFCSAHIFLGSNMENGLWFVSLSRAILIYHLLVIAKPESTDFTCGLMPLFLSCHDLSALSTSSWSRLCVFTELLLRICLNSKPFAITVVLCETAIAG